MLAVIGWLVIVVLALIFTFISLVGLMFSGMGDSGGAEVWWLAAIAAAVWYAVFHFAPFVYIGYT